MQVPQRETVGTTPPMGNKSEGMYTYTNVCIYIYTFLYTYKDIYAYINVCVYICTFIYIYTCRDNGDQTRRGGDKKRFRDEGDDTGKCVFIYIYIYIYIYINTYIHI
jgi:hypothetical protein